jgi:hypothetical protein
MSANRIQGTSAPEQTKRRALSSFAWFILSAIAAAAVPAASYADVVPSAQIQVEAVGGITIYTAGTVSGTGFNGGSEGGSSSGTATASYSGGSASVSASGSTSGGIATANSFGTASVVFYLIVSGSAPDVTTVPLIFSGNDTTSASGPEAEAQGDFETPGGQINSCSASGVYAGRCGSQPSSNSGSLDYNATPGELLVMSFLATGVSSLGTGSWSASVDPEVEIDPSFADASDFALEFSASSSSVPEPSSTLPLCIGLLAVLGAVRYKSLAK